MSACSWAAVGLGRNGAEQLFCSTAVHGVGGHPPENVRMCTQINQSMESPGSCQKLAVCWG